jgi:hypothetical protein
MMAIRIFGHALQLFGAAAVVFGLWCGAGGLRVLVSRRIDERRQSGRAAKFAVPFTIAGVGMLLLGTWLANWAAA